MLLLRVVLLKSKYLCANTGKSLGEFLQTTKHSKSNAAVYITFPVRGVRPIAPFWGVGVHFAVICQEDVCVTFCEDALYFVSHVTCYLADLLFGNEALPGFIKASSRHCALSVPLSESYT